VFLVRESPLPSGWEVWRPSPGLDVVVKKQPSTAARNRALVVHIVAWTLKWISCLGPNYTPATYLLVSRCRLSIHSQVYLGFHHMRGSSRCPGCCVRTYSLSFNLTSSKLGFECLQFVLTLWLTESWIFQYTSRHKTTYYSFYEYQRNEGSLEFMNEVWYGKM
jgi:hypothetical protein